MAMEGFLQLAQMPFGTEPLDGHDIAAFDLPQRHQAGADLLALQQHGAGAAIPGIAADLGAGQAQILAQRLGEAPGGRGLHGDAGTVQMEADHAASPMVSRARRRSTWAASRR